MTKVERKFKWSKLALAAVPVLILSGIVLAITNHRETSSHQPASSPLVEIKVENLGELKITRVKNDVSGKANVVSEKYAFKTLDNSIIEIGTERHSPPKPYLKINKWDGEVFLKVSMPFETGDNPTIIGNKVRYSTVDKPLAVSRWVANAQESQPRIDIDFYPREPEEITETINGQTHTFTQNEQGGVEFDTILYEEPLTNQIIFPIETQGLKFYYQPPLTQEEIAEGAFRPENVVGSYAVYHESKRDHIIGQTNYKTGKAFHIYRPKVYDAVGNEIWGELKIDEQKGTLTITIDQSWLNNAIYPVTIDPNFGYETIGAGYTANDNDLFGSVFTAPADIDTVSSISIGGRDSGDEAKGVIVLHSNLNIVTNGISNSVTLSGTAGFVTATFATAPALSPSTDYVLMTIFRYFSRMYYDAGDTNQGHIDSTNDYASISDPTDAGHNDNKYSLYATYEAAGGEAAAPSYTPVIFKSGAIFKSGVIFK